MKIDDPKRIEKIFESLKEIGNIPRENAFLKKHFHSALMGGAKKGKLFEKQQDGKFILIGKPSLALAKKLGRLATQVAKSWGKKTGSGKKSNSNPIVPKDSGKKSPFVMEKDIPMSGKIIKYQHLDEFMLRDLKKLPISKIDPLFIPIAVLPGSSLSNIAKRIINDHIVKLPGMKDYSIAIRTVKDADKKVLGHRIYRIA